MSLRRRNKSHGTGVQSSLPSRSPVAAPATSLLHTSIFPLSPTPSGLLSTDIAATLELCEKALADFLEAKRTIFPRFYFVSQVMLLDILSNGNRCAHEGEGVARPLALMLARQPPLSLPPSAPLCPSRPPTHSQLHCSLSLHASFPPIVPASPSLPLSLSASVRCSLPPSRHPPLSSFAKRRRLVHRPWIVLKNVNAMFQGVKEMGLEGEPAITVTTFISNE